MWLDEYQSALLKPCNVSSHSISEVTDEADSDLQMGISANPMVQDSFLDPVKAARRELKAGTLALHHQHTVDVDFLILDQLPAADFIRGKTSHVTSETLRLIQRSVRKDQLKPTA